MDDKEFSNKAKNVLNNKPSNTKTDLKEAQVFTAKKSNRLSRLFDNKRFVTALIAVIVLVGGIATYINLGDKLRPKAEYYGTYWSYNFMEEDYWDGKIHKTEKDCYNNSYICHANGSVVFNGGSAKSWKSDPNKNSTGKKLSSPTWYGPYIYSPGTYYGDNYGITGRQRLCFRLKDVRKSGSSKIAIVVHNAKYTSSYPGWPSNPDKTVYSIEGTLSSSFKRSYKDVCVDYVNPTDAVKQEYKLYVKTGQVEIDNAYQMYEYYWYDNYNYGGDGYGGKISKARQQQTNNSLSSKNAYSCSGQSKTSNKNCQLESKLRSSDAKSVLGDFKVIDGSSSTID